MKGNKKRGDRITFRLLKKMKYSDDVLDLINISTANKKCNEEILKALDFYVKYKHRFKEIELYMHFMDKLDDPTGFSEKVMEQLYLEFINEKFVSSVEDPKLNSNNSIDKKISVNSKNVSDNILEKSDDSNEVQKKYSLDNIELKNEENDVFEDIMPYSSDSDSSNSSSNKSISRAISSIRKKR